MLGAAQGRDSYRLPGFQHERKEFDKVAGGEITAYDYIYNKSYDQAMEAHYDANREV